MLVTGSASEKPYVNKFQTTLDNRQIRNVEAIKKKNITRANSLAVSLAFADWIQRYRHNMLLN